MKSRLSTKEKLTTGALAPVLVMALGACTVSAEEFKEHAIGVSESKTKVECPIYDELKPDKQAAICADYKESGKIAVVGHGIEERTLQDITQQSEQYTNDTYTTSFVFTPIMASEGLNLLVDELTEKEKDGTECLSFDNTISDLAAAAMKDALKSYDTVVALTDLPECGSINSKETKNTKDDEHYISGWFFKNTGNVSVNNVTDTSALSVITHEMGHALGLGHAGEVTEMYQEVGIIDGKKEISKVLYFTAYEKINARNITNIGKSGHFEAYGDGCTIMGSELVCQQLIDSETSEKEIPDYPYVVNPVQQHLLEWTDSNKIFTSIDLADVKKVELVPYGDDTLVTLELTEPIALTDKSDDAPAIFDYITFTTNTYVHANDWAFNMVDIYLGNQSETAYIGHIATFTPDAPNTTKLKIGNQEVTVTIKNSKITIEQSK